MTAWLPTVKVVELKVAVVTPPDVLTLTAPPALLPSIWNWTVPLGVPAPGAVMLIVAVKITLWPDVDGLAPARATVLVFALLTVCGRAIELLPAKFVSPAYEAVLEWILTAKLELVKLAVVVPLLVLRVPCPMLVPPSEKITTPLGLPAPVPDTVPVKV